LADVPDRQELSGSREEIRRPPEPAEFFGLGKIVRYALPPANADAAAKAGFFHEQCRRPLWAEDRHLKALHGLRPGNRIVWTATSGPPVASGRLVSKLNLVVSLGSARTENGAAPKRKAGA
jgi:hypothetical protein